MGRRDQVRKLLAALLSFILLFSHIFGGTLVTLAAEDSDELTDQPKEPQLIIEGDELFTPQEHYEFIVRSDMDGLLSITLEGYGEIVVDSDPIVANEPFTVAVTEMPTQEKAQFIVTVRPQNDDLNNLAVPAFEIFVINAVEKVLEDEEIEEESELLKDQQEPVTEGRARDEIGLASDEFYELGGHSWNIGLLGNAVTSEVAGHDVNASRVNLDVRDGKGKINSSTDEINFFYTTLDETATDFVLTATMSNVVVANHNEAAAGIMVRGDLIGTDNPSMVALGASNHRYILSRNEGKGLYRDTIISGQQDSEVAVEVMLQKIGDTYTVAYDRVVKEVVEASDIQYRDGKIYVGLFVARDASVTFRNLSFEVLSESDVPISLEVLGPNQSSYLEGDTFNPEGFEVIAHYSDNSKRILNDSEYYMSGFDTSMLGTRIAKINYRGQEASFEYTVTPDYVVSLKVIEPIKVEYAIDQPFDSLGMTVIAEKLSGRTVYLDDEAFTLDVPLFNEAKEVEITVTYNDDPSINNTFKVTVANRVIENLEVYRQPTRTEFIVGHQGPETVAEALLGSIIRANFSDGHREVVTLHPETGFSINYKDDFINMVGEHLFELTYMGMRTSFVFTVIPQEAIGLIVTSYPKTTYFVGEELDLEGIGVKIVYNDATQSELLEANAYNIDTTSFNNEEVGVYSFPIVGVNKEAVSLKGRLRVTVREVEDFHLGWDHIVFGQSASLRDNQMDVKGEFGTIGPDTTIELNTVNGSGKIADGHDGLNFYYRPLKNDDNFVLEADIEVVSVGTLELGTEVANQVGFGLMMTDRIGVHGDTSVWHSSMALAGSRANQNTSYWSAWTRDNRPLEEAGITPQNYRIGSTVNGVQHGRVIGSDFRDISQQIPRLFESDNPASRAHVVLERANNQIIAEITMGQETTRYELDNDIPFNMYDEDHIYVGFFTARDAHIKVTNASLRVTSSVTDAPGPIIEYPLVDPAFTVRSLNYSSTEDYELVFSANANGLVEVYQNSQLIETATVEANRVSRKWVNLSDGKYFYFRYTPDSALDNISNFEAKTHGFNVNYHFTEGDIYVSPDGNGVGTAINPMSFTRAVRELQPGNTIILTEGWYPQLIIPQWNSGRNQALKQIVSEDGVVIEGARIDGDFWHLLGLRFDEGIVRVGGNDNVIELATIANAPNTGLQIGRSVAADSSIHFDIQSWPSRNLILNSEAYNSMDSAKTDADGFAAKLTVGEGNRFVGCVSHHNIDDGWDLYAKSVPIGAVVIESSISHSNGRIIGSDEMRPEHMGNGFKLGGEGVPIAHVIKNSKAFHNGSYGFTSNSNPMLIAENNVGFDNRLANISLTSYTNIAIRDYRVTDFFSYRRDTETWGTHEDVIQTGVYGRERYTAESVYLFNGSQATNSLGRLVTDDFFVSLEVPETSRSFPRDTSIKGDKTNLIGDGFLDLTDFAYEHRIEQVRQELQHYIGFLESLALESKDYQKNLWDHYEEALDKAIAVLENSKSTSEIQEVLNQLTHAFVALDGVDLSLEEARQLLKDLMEQIIELIDSKELVANDYTKETWTILMTALEQAQLSVNSEDLKEIEAAYQTLAEAFKALEEKSNIELAGARQQLQEFIEKIKEMIETGELEAINYTKETWYALMTALEQAQLAVTSLDLKEIKEANEILERALDGLEEKLEEESNTQLEEARQRLQELIKKIKAMIDVGDLLATNYTIKTWIYLIEALEHAQSVILSEDIDIVEAAYLNLNQAWEALEEVEALIKVPDSANQDDLRDLGNGNVSDSRTPDSQNKLPDTGQHHTMFLSVLGYLLVGLATMIKFTKNTSSKN